MLKSSVVGNNTRRELEVEECRGFALPDKIAPLVFVNSRDAVSAQIFTLIHELAHIWLNEAGISNLDPEKAGQLTLRPQVERVCNAVAVEVLLPRAEFRASWPHSGPVEAAVESLCREYRAPLEGIDGFGHPRRTTRSSPTQQSTTS